MVQRTWQTPQNKTRHGGRNEGNMTTPEPKGFKLQSDFVLVQRSSFAVQDDIMLKVHVQGGVPLGLHHRVGRH